ncbi:unnamed protein product [Microthlaspi erraticum]|uniref:RNase H type-1 domain-containing protein n=1 Tax=Microthlaspi erraticum TaxID=1685480 RepID=A0A6D2HVA3_9BRAS|nr:unnamed protein product [Microthlaspi erraticum]
MDLHGQFRHKSGPRTSIRSFVTSLLMVEALSFRSALNHALEIGITTIHLKSDARDLVRAINMQEQIAEIYGILFDVKTLASMFSSISFSFISRSENDKADLLAKNAKSRPYSTSVTGDI